MIKLEDCVDRGLYQISSRNLTFGVFNKETKGFVGIREKFGHRYVFQEYHYDTGAPFGTVKPIKLLETCPIEDLREYKGSIDLVTGRLVGFKDGWYYLDTGELSRDIRPVSQFNKELFDWLKQKEAQYSEK